MDRIWQAQYLPSMKKEILPLAYDSLVDIIQESIRKYSDKVAYSNFGGKRTYEEVGKLSRDFAAYLQSELGVKKGDRIALMAPNCMAFPIAMYGIIFTGAIQVNVNPMYTAREMNHQLLDSDTDTIIIFTGSTPVLAQAMEGTKIKNVITMALDDCIDIGIPSPPPDDRVQVTATFLDALKKGANLDFLRPSISSEDPLFLQYTGGTTGLSKGAVLTHGNLVSNIAQFEAVMSHILEPENEVVITAIPLYHIFALMVNGLTYFKLGGINVLITNPRDMAGFAAEMAKWKPTAITGVNTLYNGMCLTPGFRDVDFSRLKIAIGGGAAVQEAVSDKWNQMTGQHICQGYGLSETSPLVSVNTPVVQEFSGTIGLPVASTDISIRDEEGKELGFDEPGELCVKGPQVTPGYWRQDEANKEAFWKDGFFKTGDIAQIDARGHIKIVDRKKDMVIVSGFNVFPNEIEALVAEMDSVIESACIGVPDEKTGEAVKLFVVKKEESLTAEEVIAYCRKNIAAYKVPKQVEFIAEVPKSAVGKLLRRELR